MSMTRIEGCSVTTAKSTEEIVENVKENITSYKGTEVTDASFWREGDKIAIVGGGPSLKYTLKDLRKFKNIVACGSVHDYLISNDIYPDYCVLCDPDDIVNSYLAKKSNLVKYLVASQCSPKVFEHLSDCKVYIWHANSLDNSVFASNNKTMIGGGCTVGTRAISIAVGMGYNDVHLFGFDTCLDDKFSHHAYEFIDKEKESIGNIVEICLDKENGKKFHVAGYMLGQLFDFQKMLQIYAHKAQITIYGDGLLSHLMELAKRNVENDKEN